MHDNGFGPESESSQGAGSDPLAEEMARLFSSVQDWARRSFPEAGHTGPECQWCPLCQFVAVLRGDRPDVTERVNEVGSAVIAAVRAVVDAAAAAANNAAAHADRSNHQDHVQPRVQKIDLNDEA